MWDKYRRNSKGWEKDPPAILHPRIWLGSADIPYNPNITHAINCAGDEFTHPLYEDRTVCLGAYDNINEDITRYYPLFEENMNKFLCDPACNIVYVHCECGINRSGFLMLIYLCRKFGLTLEESIKAITIQRPCALTNPAFRRQVVEYIKKHE
jgi:hypothetical protein